MSKKYKLSLTVEVDELSEVEPLPPSNDSNVPSLDLYRTNALTYGKKHADYLARTNEPFDPQLDATYYDGIDVYLQLLKQSRWFGGTESFAHIGLDNCLRVYRDGYVFANKGGASAYYTFTRGLLNHFKATGDEKSKEAVRLLATRSAYAYDGVNTSGLEGFNYSREVAYTLQAFLDYALLFSERRPNTDQFIKFALGHLDQVVTESLVGTKHVEPFMVALTCRTLIRLDSSDLLGVVYPGPNIDDAMSWLWENTWNEEAKGFAYSWAKNPADLAGDGANPARDLNLLIAPIFAWLFKQTSEEIYKERCDLVWQGGVENAYLDRGKQFNQNYAWSLDALTWLGVL